MTFECTKVPMGKEIALTLYQHGRDTSSEMPMSTAEQLYIEKHLIDHPDF